MTTINIEPVTRIEGHAKITIKLDERGNVEDAQFHVTEFRGFEKLCEGRPFHEMPSLMSRICGICCISHQLASAKACDALMAVRVPEAAISLRRIANLAQMIQSHALSFFYLSSPDLLLGMDSKPSERNILGLMKDHPQLARNGVALRRLGQEIVEILSGKRLNSSWIVPGGVNAPLTEDARDKIRTRIPEAMSIAQQTLDWYKTVLEKYREEIRTFANFPSLFMSLVTPNGELEYYHGRLRVVDSTGTIVDDQLDPTLYSNYIGESVLPYSYLKAPYYKSRGFSNGVYRVGPLARLNVIDRTGTPRAEEEWVEYRTLRRQAILSNFHNHYARLIEVLYSIERIQQLLEDPNITSTRVRVTAGANTAEGVGVTEAPRGTLIHHYKTNDDGLITWANLIVATGHNNLAMNHGVLQAAKHFINNGQPITEGILNRVEAVIRTFDPCLSCSTHAIGKMPLDIRIIDNNGQVVSQLKRD
ncbi:MAG TPA: Ni/Fe hydrogenase subunit alpha [Candidatus Bathyarchaeia archaeon]|nr:Ni/Fe hydrogenase subunit alpha [Candidatus Bathyarchaeia archaeon]